MADRKDDRMGGAQAASSGATSATKPQGGPRDRSAGADMRGVGDMASDAMQQARGYAGDAVDQARGMAGQLAQDVREVAESLIDEQKERAAGHVTGVAEALRKTAEGLGEHNEVVGRYAEQAADQVERFAESIRDRNLGDLIADVDDFARRQPTMFLVGAVALGFVVGRFMAASSERTRREHVRDYARQVTPRPTGSRTRTRTAGYAASSGAGNGHVSTYQRGSA
jgi:hypothetical protein